MFWRKKKNICGYCDCRRRIPEGSVLCEGHYNKWVDGLIDRCPKCGRFKDVMYQMCLDCYFGRPVKPWKPSAELPPQSKTYKVQYSDAWVDGYMRPDRFFVYILGFDEGGFYVGHTTDLRKQLSEYRDDRTSSAAGRNPKLQYAQIIATQKAAEMREAELKRLIDSNPDQVRLMISEFHRHMREFGLE